MPSAGAVPCEYDQHQLYINSNNATRFTVGRDNGMKLETYHIVDNIDGKQESLSKRDSHSQATFNA